MRFLIYLADFLVPFLLFYILATALMEKRPVYEDFLEGAGEGLKIILRLLPTLIGLLTATGILRASGFLDMLARVLDGAASKIGFPPPLIPVALVRLFSSSAAVGLVLDIFKEYGTDSTLGLTASLMMSCTETVFYTMSVYFAAAKVSKTRYTLAGALLASVAGIIASLALAQWMPTP